MVGGTMLHSMALAHKAISIPPSRAKHVPVAPLVELIATFLACEPKTVLIAWVSARSPWGVDAAVGVDVGNVRWIEAANQAGP